MPRVSAPIYSLNGGEVGKEALSRLDLERLQFAGSLYSNIMPRVVGSMTLRAGLEHIANLGSGDVKLIEYTYSGSQDTVLVPILTNGEMKVIRGDAFVSRAAVSTTIADGDFAALTGWTDASVGGATASVSGGQLILTGTTQSRASIKQTIAVSGGDQGIEHAVRLEVARGPIYLRLGSTAGAADLIAQAVLEDGSHSIAFTPTTSNVYIELFTDKARASYLDSCEIEGAGDMVLDTPWSTAADLARIRYKKNADVIYTASGVFQQREIQRRGDTSWGIQRFKVEDGPFVTPDRRIALTPSVLTGNGTLTAGRDYFEPGMVGRLFRLFQASQSVREDFSAAPSEGASIRVSGVGSFRAFSYGVFGTWSGNVRLQVATDDGSGNPGAWTDLFSFTSNVSSTYQDPDNNVVKFFRFVVPSGGYTSGLIETSLGYIGGSQTGVARMTGYTSATVASIEVLERFYATASTTEWDHSVWSDFDGWPWAVEAFGGRLYWGLKDTIYGSVPDAFRSYSDEIEGDSATIARSIGASTDRGILWLLGLSRLLAGTDHSEISVKASSFEEPLTPSAWFPVEASTQGSLNMRAVKCDADGIFIQSSGTGVFALTVPAGASEYQPVDLTEMHEEICDGSPIVSVTVQRRPDTVVWFVLENGEARALTYKPVQRVVAWSRVVTDGDLKDVVTIRGALQDNVYFAVERDGTQRLERMANLSDCRGGEVNCLADAFTRFTATASQTVFPVPHLDGLDVTVWVDGAALRDQDNLYTVASGQVVLSAQPEGTSVVIGLPYTARWKSTKLAYGAGGGTALFQKKRVSQLGMYLCNTMLDGLRVGDSFARLRKLTVTKGDKPIPANYLFEEYDADMMPISSDWDTDSRICLEVRSPYPFTAASLVLDAKTNG